MIYAVNMTCARDAELEQLMADTLEKQCKDCEVLLSLNTDGLDYGNGAGWLASMMKVEAIRQLLNENQVKDDDFVLSVDSDVVFTSPEVFKYINPSYGIIGIKHRPEYYTHRPEYYTRFMQWSHMSGALIFIRGDIAKKIAALSEFDLDLVRFSHFKPYALTENEDVVLSYLAKFVGANYFDIGTVEGLSSGDFESDIQTGSYRSFYHLNYCPTQFLGEQVQGKWDIAKVLKMKGIEL